MDSHRNDILLVEQIERLTRLSNSDWMTLKKQLEQHELRIVSFKALMHLPLKGFQTKRQAGLLRCRGRVWCVHS